MTKYELKGERGQLEQVVEHHSDGLSVSIESVRLESTPFTDLVRTLQDQTKQATGSAAVYRSGLEPAVVQYGRDGLVHQMRSLALKLENSDQSRLYQEAARKIENGEALSSVQTFLTEQHQPLQSAAP